MNSKQQSILCNILVINALPPGILKHFKAYKASNSDLKCRGYAWIKIHTIPAFIWPTHILKYVYHLNWVPYKPNSTMIQLSCITWTFLTSVSNCLNNRLILAYPSIFTLLIEAARQTWLVCIRQYSNIPKYIN